MVWTAALCAFAGGLLLGVALGGLHASWRAHRRWTSFERSAWQARADKRIGRS